ncbi:MAG: hypothetical protein BWY31_04703 [Lentisphaerae bacterium ADurb.Bin242]|nr:MAG: hypothetical protein BWY31_04703 [Lentisphaerae bacterium ADurb.Bin242]
MTGEPPLLTVQPDGKFDFEDLAAFVWMWNWFSEKQPETGSRRPEGPVILAAGKAEKRTDTGSRKAVEGKMLVDRDGTRKKIGKRGAVADFNHVADEMSLRFEPRGDGAVDIIGGRPIDFLRLIVESAGNAPAPVSFSPGDWWAVERRGIALTRAYPGGIFEAAAALLEEPENIRGDILLGTLHCSAGAGNLVIRHTCRAAGGETLSSGSITLKAEDIRPRPASFALRRNMPNPFNPSTMIRFELPWDSHVRLIIRNLSGQKVAVLHDSPTPAGLHAVRWDASGYPSGVYFYTLEAEGFVETRRMTLVK